MVTDENKNSSDDQVAQNYNIFYAIGKQPVVKIITTIPFTTQR
jgi:hypothetical protein